VFVGERVSFILRQVKRVVVPGFCSLVRPFLLYCSCLCVLILSFLFGVVEWDVLVVQLVLRVGI